MLERTDAITKEVLEPITFVLPYPTVFFPAVSRRDEGRLKSRQQVSNEHNYFQALLHFTPLIHCNINQRFLK